MHYIFSDAFSASIEMMIFIFFLDCGGAEWHDSGGLGTMLMLLTLTDSVSAGLLLHK